MKIVKKLPIALLLLLLLLLTPEMNSKCQPPGMNCTSDSNHCTSKCCLGERNSWLGIGCTLMNNSYCNVVWEKNVKVSCPSGGCIVNFDKKQCAFHSGPPSCSLDDYYEVQGCCLNPSPTPVGSKPTATSGPTRTRTPTRTPTPTRTMTPTLTIDANLTARYGWPLLWGPELGFPAQTLDGTIFRGIPPFTGMLYVEDPGGAQAIYPFSTLGTNATTFSFGPVQAGDSFFGVSKLGTWSAWFTVRDSMGNASTSNTATWQVSFYPVHGRP